MAFKMLYDIDMDDTTSELNAHFTGILKPGVYEGMIVTSNDSNSSVTVTAGSALDATGQLIISDASELVSVVSPSHPSYDRIDTVCLVVNKDLARKYNLAFFTSVKGTASRNPFPTDLSAKPGYMPIAHIYIKAGSAKIQQNDIAQINRIYNNKAVVDSFVRSAFSSLYGSRLIEGFDIEVDDLTNTVTVFPGKAVVDGMLVYNEAQTTLSLPRMPYKFKDISATNVGQISNISQPYIPTRLEIVVSLSAASTLGQIIVSGKNGNGELTSEIVTVRESNSIDTLAIFRTTNFFSIIDGVQLSSFTSNATRVQITGLNEISIFLKEHEVGGLAPIEYTYKTQTMVGSGYFLLGVVVSKFDGADNSLVIKQSSPRPAKPIFGIILEGEFRGANGVQIEHGLGVTDIKKYSVVITPKDTDFNTASTVGTVWVRKEPNRITVCNAGSARCAFDATITVGV